MSSKVVLILGAGERIGKSLSQKFASNGYKVAVASRTLHPAVNEAADTSIKADFSNPLSIKSIFAEVHAKLGAPNVVVYNAAGYNSVAPNILSNPLSVFESHLAINVTSVYAAAQEAVAGFEKLPKDTNKVFIYTGNALNVIDPIPPLLTLGVGKSAGSHLIQASSMAFKDKGYQFYYADERKADGSVLGNEISGDFAAEHYFDLAKEKEQGPWLQTFVGGKGYVNFQ